MSSPIRLYVRLRNERDPSKTTLLTIDTTRDLVYDDLVQLVLESVDPEREMGLRLVPGPEIAWMRPISRVLFSRVGTTPAAPFTFTVGRSSLVPGPRERGQEEAPPPDPAATRIYDALRAYLMKEEREGEVFSTPVALLEVRPRLEGEEYTVPLYLRPLVGAPGREDILSRRLRFVAYGGMPYVWAAYRRLSSEDEKQELRDLKGPSLGEAILSIPTAERLDLVFTFFPIYERALLTETEKREILTRVGRFIQEIVDAFLRQSREK